jgi:hypothetical protein
MSGLQDLDRSRTIFLSSPITPDFLLFSERPRKHALHIGHLVAQPDVRGEGYDSSSKRMIIAFCSNICGFNDYEPR